MTIPDKAGRSFSSRLDGFHNRDVVSSQTAPPRAAMNNYLKFDPQFRRQLSERGIAFEWLVSLFLGSNPEYETAPPLLDGISAAQKAFAIRQTLATDITYTSLRDKQFSCADPFVAGARCVALVCQTPDRQESLPYALLPIFYGCRSASGEEFWVCVYGTFGRVTQVFFPERQLVVFDIFHDTAEAVIGCLQSWLSRHPFQGAAPLAARERSPAPCIGLLDMVTNFGHQAINHLSGVQRVLDFGLLHQMDELWVCGVLFFGQLESLFPELSGRIRYFPNRWEVAKELVYEPRQIVRIGSTYLPSSVRRRIMRHVPAAEVARRQHVLVVTVRAAGRTCVNLPEVVAELYERLRKTFELTIALDGWVIPESALAARTSAGAAPQQYVHAIQAEKDLAHEIEKRLPRGAVSAITIGRSMLESLNDLSAATCYFAHVGTLQHKLGLLLRLPGVVHGPRLQVCAPEGGPYYSEDGVPPVFMPESAIEDLPTTSNRGRSFADYRIVDMTFTIDALARVMQPI